MWSLTRAGEPWRFAIPRGWRMNGKDDDDQHDRQWDRQLGHSMAQLRFFFKFNKQKTQHYHDCTHWTYFFTPLNNKMKDEVEHVSTRSRLVCNWRGRRPWYLVRSQVFRIREGIRLLLLLLLLLLLRWALRCIRCASCFTRTDSDEIILALGSFCASLCCVPL